MYFFIFIIIIIVFTYLIINTNENFNNYDPSSLKINVTCINPKVIIINNNKLEATKDNFQKAMDYCLGNDIKAFMELDGYYAYSNKTLKIRDDSNDKYKAWISNPSLYDSDITINKHNISINKEINPNYYLDVNGSLLINTDDNDNDVLCLKDDKGLECLSSNDIYTINKLPISFTDSEVLCLNDSDGNPVCVNKDELGILSGTTRFNLRNISESDYSTNTYLSKGDINYNDAKVSLNRYYKVPAKSQDCVADYGKNINDDVCCGQSGKVNEAKFICKEEAPKCSYYVANKTYGKCGPKIETITQFDKGQHIPVYDLQEGLTNENIASFFISPEKDSSIKKNTLPLLNYKY